MQPPCAILGRLLWLGLWLEKPASSKMQCSLRARPVCLYAVVYILGLAWLQDRWQQSIRLVTAASWPTMPDIADTHALLGFSKL